LLCSSRQFSDVLRDADEIEMVEWAGFWGPGIRISLTSVMRGSFLCLLFYNRENTHKIYEKEKGIVTIFYVMPKLV